MIMMQVWQVMDCVNGSANIHALHGMLYIVFALFLFVVIEVALIYNYIVLSMEQPRWWWRIWWGSACVGMWIFLCLLTYLLEDLRVQYVTTLISYVAACALVSSLMALMVASLAMICTFRFNLRIYSHVKLQ